MSTTVLCSGHPRQMHLELAPFCRERMGLRIDNAAVVLAQLPLWIEDYDEVHPHKG
jgi:hypothetical protein